MLNQDNSVLRKQVKNHFETGKKWYADGDTIAKKEKGFLEMKKGLQKLGQWIQREHDGAMKDKLKKYYNAHIDEMRKMKLYIEECQEE